MGRWTHVKVSIVLPVYNGSKTLGRTLESILIQEHNNYEVIAIDDGSQDNSRELLEKYKNKFPCQFIILAQENKGVSAARNKGISYSSGEYIAFIDQDDIWEADKLSRQVEICRCNLDIDFIFCDFYRFNCENLKTYELSNSDLNYYIHEFMHSNNVNKQNVLVCNGDEMFELLLKGYPIYPSTMFVKRNLLVQVNLWDNRFPKCQDFDLSLRCSKYANFAYIDETLAGIGRHNNNVSNDPIEQKVEDAEVLYHHLREDYFNIDKKKTIRKNLVQRVNGIAWNYKSERQFSKARMMYINGMRNGGGFIYALVRVILTFAPFRFITVRAKSKNL